MFYMLTALVAASFILYLVFIGQTVFLLVNGKNIELEKRAISTEISELELQTLSLNDTISIEKAYELGFVDAPSTQFVTTRSFVSLR